MDRVVGLILLPLLQTVMVHLSTHLTEQEERFLTCYANSSCSLLIHTSNDLGARPHERFTRAEDKPPTAYECLER